MFKRVYPLFEDGHVEASIDGLALAKLIEIHPDLEPLLDFYSADALEMAHEIGMVYPHEEDADEDLNEIDFGPREWHEPAAGIAAVERALTVLRADPESVRRFLYDPTLGREDVIRDLESLLAALEAARDRETRFCLAVDGESGAWPRPGR